MFAEETLKEYESQLAPSSPNVRKGRLHYARSFLETCADGITADAVRAWRATLEKQGLSPGTVRQALSIAKRTVKLAGIVHDRKVREQVGKTDVNQPHAVEEMLKIMNTPRPEWPLPDREMPSLGGERRETFTREEAKALVHTVAHSRSNPTHACFTALASTYGMRKAEIQELSPEHINLKESIIYIPTRKHGRKRYHLIPHEITPYLEAHDFGQYFSNNDMWVMFAQVCYKAGVENREQLGWHSWRRYLDSELTLSLNRSVVRRFMRWKEHGMEEIYFTAEDREVDQQVFNVHPLLGEWDGTEATSSR